MHVLVSDFHKTTFHPIKHFYYLKFENNFLIDYLNLLNYNEHFDIDLMMELHKSNVVNYIIRIFN